MKENQVLEDLGIKTLKKLENEEKKLIINNFAKKIIDILPENYITFNEIVDKMSICEMYIADFEDFKLTANYYFKNQTIYLNAQTDYMNMDEYVIHECIHFLQDTRVNGHLNRFGLCECLESKVIGLGLNEAALQYIVNKITCKQSEEIIFGKIKMKTKNKNYYPIISNLGDQIAYLIGDKELIESTLFSNENFKNKFIDLCGEKTFKTITTLLEKILELENNDNELEDENIAEKIGVLYEKAQNTLLSGYFYGFFPLIETSKELEDYAEKLEGVKLLLGNIDNFTFYEELKEIQMKKIKNRIIKMNRKSANKALIKKANGIFSKLIMKIRSVFSNI